MTKNQAKASTAKNKGDKISFAESVAESLLGPANKGKRVTRSGGDQNASASQVTNASNVNGENQPSSPTKGIRDNLWKLRQCLGGENPDLLKCMQVVADLMEDNVRLVARVKTLEEKLQKKEEDDIQKEKNRQKEACHQKRNHLLIRGAQIHSNAKDGIETSQQTTQVVQNILKDIGVQNEVKPSNIRRMKIMDATVEGGKSKRMAAIKIELHDDNSRHSLFSKIGKWKRTAQNKSIRFVQDYPDFLRKENEALEKVAYQLRTSGDKKIKTRIVCKDASLQLLVKGPGDRSFVPYKHQDEV